ncbi:MAG: helix-turn-helix transcriptional regulator [Flavobacterium sp.]|nr:helix-turn-helix transcriptional regulator [Flavobacterium sp.]
MSVGIKIKRLRENKKMSQVELSTILGISQTKLCNIESNEDKSIDFNLMDKVCKLFNVGFEYFLNEQQINNVERNEGGVVGSNYGNVYHYSDKIAEQIKSLVAEIKLKDQKIITLENQIEKLKK